MAILWFLTEFTLSLSKGGLANALPVRNFNEGGPRLDACPSVAFNEGRMRSPVVTELVEVYYLGLEPVWWIVKSKT